jgi:hypothetical protein
MKHVHDYYVRVLQTLIKETWISKFLYILSFHCNSKKLTFNNSQHNNDNNDNNDKCKNNEFVSV